MRKIKDFSERPIAYRDLENSDEYLRFMKWMPKYADNICVTCAGLDYSGFQESKWNFLNNSILDHEYTVDSPVTHGPEAMLLYLSIDYVTSKWIREKKNIYDFMEPVINKKDYIWLYDLCLVKNHRLELCSCSHEQFCYISREMLEAYKNNKRT